jgi:Zn-dependent peptidase ImmA (M78 family)
LLQAAGVSTQPLPIRDLAHGCGVQTLPWDLEGQDIDGRVAGLDDGVVIWVNQTRAVTFQRFTLAHELGHHLLRHADDSTSTSAAIWH